MANLKENNLQFPGQKTYIHQISIKTYNISDLTIFFSKLKKKMCHTVFMNR